jgi:hypothetical protein
MLKRPTWTLLCGAVAIAWLAVWALALVWGELNQDEGWYLYAAGMVADGRLPYRDFAFTQGPVMAYVYALGNPLVSSLGVAGGRLLTLVFGVAAVACAAVLAGRLAPASRRGAAVLAVAALAGLNAYQAYFFTVVKTYALTALLVAAGLLLLLEAARGRLLPAAAAGVCLTLAAGTRLSAAFLLPVLFVYLAVERRRIGWRPCACFAFGGAVTAVLLFGPFLVLAPDGLWFGLVEYHGSRAGGGSALLYKAGSVARLLQAYTVAAVVAVAVLAWRFRSGSAGVPDQWRVEDRFSVAAAAGLALVALVHLAAPFPYDDYQTFLFPCAAAILARALAGSLPDQDGQQRVWLAAVALAALLGTVGAPSLQNMFLAGQDRIWWRVRSEPQVVTLRRAAATVRAMAGPSDLLLTQDLYLAVEARMRVPSGLELGPFSYYPAWPTALAEKRRVVNRERIEAIMASGEAPVAAFSGYGLAVESPKLTPVPEAERRRLLGVLGGKYELAAEVPSFGQAGTVLSVYRRREGGEVAK